MRLQVYSGLPVSDLDELLAIAPEVWEGLRGARIFLTGASGFVGRWMLEALARANQKLDLGAEITVLVRNADAFKEKLRLPRDCDSLNVVVGDVRDFVLPRAEFTHVVHLAASSDAAVQASDPAGLFSVIIDGTRRVLDLAAQSSACRFLLVSSGAVYGSHPHGNCRISEEYTGAADCTLPGSVYATAKRAAEQIGVLRITPALKVVIARPFAFIGPGLPLDAHFAAGNFIRDGLAGGPIRVNGDGSPLRSYLYAADMTWWLWKVLVAGVSGRAYNVGGEQEMSIKELADAVAGCFIPRPGVTVRYPVSPGRQPESYVPDTSRARQELGLYHRISLAESLRRTVSWHTAHDE